MYDPEPLEPMNICEICGKYNFDEDWYCEECCSCMDCCKCIEKVYLV